MAKSNDKGGQEKPANPAMNHHVGSAITDAIATLIGSAGFEVMQSPTEGEEEVAYVLRVLPIIAEAIGIERKQRAEAFDALKEELKALKRQLASQRGVATKAKARIVALEEASKPRKLGPMASVFDDLAEDFVIEDLMTAIDGAEEIVLAFSDGENELRGIRPRQVRAEAFQLRRGRLLFTDAPLEVTGPGGGHDMTTLAGVALLIDGEQAAWSPMAKPLAIGAGQTVNLAGSVIFG